MDNMGKPKWKDNVRRGEKTPQFRRQWPYSKSETVTNKNLTRNSGEGEPENQQPNNSVSASLARSLETAPPPPGLLQRQLEISRSSAPRHLYHHYPPGLLDLGLTPPSSPQHPLQGYFIAAEISRRIYGNGPPPGPRLSHPTVLLSSPFIPGRVPLSAPIVATLYRPIHLVLGPQPNPNPYMRALDLTVKPKDGGNNAQVRDNAYDNNVVPPGERASTSNRAYQDSPK